VLFRLLTAFTLIAGLTLMSEMSEIKNASAQSSAPASTPTSAPATAAAQAPGAIPPPPKIVSDLANQRIRFDFFCFTGQAFPACDFENPELAKSYLGPYTLKTSFYDAAGNIVTSAKTPGRYAAVVEITREDGRKSHRFVTLCRMGDKSLGEAQITSQPAAVALAGIDEKLLADRADEIERWTMGRPWYGKSTPASREAALAVAAAGLYDLAALKAQDKPLPTESLLRLDRQWWLTFKRNFYSLDKIYTKPFTCPQTFNGPPAIVVHQGSLADAGMKADAVETIDANCQAWEKEIGKGFSLVVLRHGVVVFNKAYGSTKARLADPDVPFTTETVGPLASTTKFLTAIMLSEFADQGLIDLDAPVADYLPALRGIKVDKPLIIRDMLIHIAGFDGHYGDLNNDLEEIVADFYPSLEVGKLHRYEGVSLALSGKIMEMISGQIMPQLFHRCLFNPLDCRSMDTEMTSAGASANAMDLAKIGQLMLNGGSYGHMRFTSPATIAKLMPIAGKDRFAPDMTIRWGIGMKIFDTDCLSDKSFGHPGAGGSCLVIDPDKDLVISMIRFSEGGSYEKFLKRKGEMFQAILAAIEK
jgi:CubicO group peptidase (beta-lactamase class C family)